ncbi:hypothetical protein QJQ45_020794 [Haematococcus lacustris]|nr:hypothetical protein QJQ45_020794 [Haematococcus lacustris]
MGAKLLPWTCWQEWEDTGRKLLSAQERAEGLARVKPTGCTEAARPGRLQSSALWRRLVNGVSDAQQRGRVATSLTLLASSAGLPRVLVDIRHDATHGELPSLALLRAGAAAALHWLQGTYWDGQARHVQANLERAGLLLRALMASCQTAATTLPGSNGKATATTKASKAGRGSSSRGSSRGSSSSSKLHKVWSHRPRGRESSDEEEEGEEEEEEKQGGRKGKRLAADAEDAQLDWRLQCSPEAPPTTPTGKQARRELVSALRALIPTAWCSTMVPGCLRDLNLSPPLGRRELSAWRQGCQGLGLLEHPHQLGQLLDGEQDTAAELAALKAWFTWAALLFKAYPSLRLQLLRSCVSRLAILAATLSASQGSIAPVAVSDLRVRHVRQASFPALTADPSGATPAAGSTPAHTAPGHTPAPCPLAEQEVLSLGAWLVCLLPLTLNEGDALGPGIRAGSAAARTPNPLGNHTNPGRKGKRPRRDTQPLPPPQQQQQQQQQHGEAAGSERVAQQEADQEGGEGRGPAGCDGEARKAGQVLPAGPGCWRVGAPHLLRGTLPLWPELSTRQLLQLLGECLAGVSQARLAQAQTLVPCASSPSRAGLDPLPPTFSAASSALASLSLLSTILQRHMVLLAITPPSHQLLQPHPNPDPRPQAHHSPAPISGSPGGEGQVWGSVMQKDPVVVRAEHLAVLAALAHPSSLLQAPSSPNTAPAHGAAGDGVKGGVAAGVDDAVGGRQGEGGQQLAPRSQGSEQQQAAATSWQSSLAKAGSRCLPEPGAGREEREGWEQHGQPPHAEPGLDSMQPMQSMQHDRERRRWRRAVGWQACAIGCLPDALSPSGQLPCLQPPAAAAEAAKAEEAGCLGQPGQGQGSNAGAQGVSHASKEVHETGKAVGQQQQQGEGQGQEAGGGQQGAAEPGCHEQQGPAATGLARRLPTSTTSDQGPGRGLVAEPPAWNLDQKTWPASSAQHGRPDSLHRQAAAPDFSTSSMEGQMREAAEQEADAEAKAAMEGSGELESSSSSSSDSDREGQGRAVMAWAWPAALAGVDLTEVSLTVQRL